MHHFQHIMLYCFKKGKNATEMQKKTGAVSGEGAVTDRMCQKWFVKYRAGDSLGDDVPRSGRPVEGKKSIWDDGRGDTLKAKVFAGPSRPCLLYTSDAADDWLVV